MMKNLKTFENYDYAAEEREHHDKTELNDRAEEIKKLIDAKQDHSDKQHRTADSVRIDKEIEALQREYKDITGEFYKLEESRLDAAEYDRMKEESVEFKKLADKLAKDLHGKVTAKGIILSLDKAKDGLESFLDYLDDECNMGEEGGDIKLSDDEREMAGSFYFKNEPGGS